MRDWPHAYGSQRVPDELQSAGSAAGLHWRVGGPRELLGEQQQPHRQRAPDDQKVDESHLGVCRRLRRFDECPVRRPAACATICPDAASARMGEVPADQRLPWQHERVRVPVAEGCDGGLRQVGPEWNAHGLGAHYRRRLRCH